MNFGPQPLKVEYTDGNKSFFKTLPTNAFVAMKNLNDYSQIANRDFLVNHANATIYNFEMNTYLNRNAATPTGATMPFVFIDNNKKPGEVVTFTATGVTAGYNQLKTLMNA
jgi:hypothetical protein